jgi:hypothetical protein
MAVDALADTEEKFVCGSLTEIERQFTFLQSKHAEFGKGRSWPGECSNLEQQWESQTSAILDQMWSLSWQAEAAHALNLAELRAKANILLEWCVGRDGDIVHSLAASLSRDVCILLSAEAVSRESQDEGQKCSKTLRVAC